MTAGRAHWAQGWARRVPREEAGQALILALAGSLVLIAAALAVVAIAGAVTGKGRAQRIADLAAISAARSLLDDLPRRLAPPVLPGGLANPVHLSRVEYLARARSAAAEATTANGADARRLLVTFPGASGTAPWRVRAELVAAIDGEDGTPVRVSAEAEVGSSASPAASATASGGGYSGPLVVRDGEGMRPDVGAAYDRMELAARAAGHDLIVVSGFRSDAEQAVLFAANPDPNWVAPPGKSLHRCATELDLGPSSAYGWLAANAPGFGFQLRYHWEPWHFGFLAGPEPCSPAGEALVAGRGSGPGGGPVSIDGGLPGFVPSEFRAPLLRSGARWRVSPALLAAQLMAESGFDPTAVSPAGAAGIAQFMPGTAAAYGLRDPFDPVAAIEAQAHLMADLLRQFGSPELALAAYNAGPGAVEPCNCIPPYPETQAYVARILALLGGSASGLLGGGPAVRLVE